MNRRDFLRYHLQGAFALAAGSTGLLLPKESMAVGEPDIVVVEGAPGAATRAALNLLGGMGQFVKPGDRVLIKPNMSFSHPPESATNTHPEVVRELAVMCKEAGAAKVLILDNPLASAKRCLERSGIYDTCNPIDDCTVAMITSSKHFKRVDIPKATDMTSNEVMKEVLKSDVLIAAPVAKSHAAAGVSLSMKGMMGLIRKRRAMHWRYDLDTSIVDLCTLLKADLAVIDASRVLSTNGPGGPGKVLHEKKIIVSKDMVAADACAVSMFEWYGRRFKPRQVGHILEAHKRGLGRMDVENLTIKTMTL
ncbi:MAG: DUF362 domain-containing protein [Deltaproteobacteria bacterium]|nr:DUF362 domain-containing protein [Deltaproteobacteria bacterium]MBW2086845.1 DUF362 domain-containing protein [Deltaproteobacteria bacterium]